MTSAVAATLRPVPIPASNLLRRDPVAQAGITDLVRRRDVGRILVIGAR